MLKSIWEERQKVIAIIAVLAIAIHLSLRWSSYPFLAVYPLYAALVLGGIPLVGELLGKLLRRQFGSDLLAGFSIVTSVILGEYLAGTLVVLMLSGGEAIESYAKDRASSVLRALASRMPQKAHRRIEGGKSELIALDDIEIGDKLEVFPHEICPVDGIVCEGHGRMDEAYITGEPYVIAKVPGSRVISGAVNSDTLLVVETTSLPKDSRYARIMKVVEQSEANKPQMQRLGDELGAWYTPLALLIAGLSWYLSGDATRFLAVLVVATPCPLLIAIPVAIIGAISTAARHGIVIRNPGAFEKVALCRTVIFDKTGTLTYGRPNLVDELTSENKDELLGLVATVERYSRHPLAQSIVQAAQSRGIASGAASRISELPGRGLTGFVNGREVFITSRSEVLERFPDVELPPQAGGLECAVVLDGKYAALYRFRDEPREDGGSFIRHLNEQHHFNRVMLVSGDRESEVRYLAESVGIEHVLAEQSPEDKLAIVKDERSRAEVMFVGDGINDAPAMIAATVGVAIGDISDVTAESADVVIMDSSLVKVDNFFHISQKMRRIALESALLGILLSIGGMFLAAAGLLPPVAGALLQEVIDVFAVLNALRATFIDGDLTDYEHSGTSS